LPNDSRQVLAVGVAHGKFAIRLVGDRASSRSWDIGTPRAVASTFAAVEEEDAIADRLGVTHLVLRVEQEQWSAALNETSKDVAETPWQCGCVFYVDHRKSEYPKYPNFARPPAQRRFTDGCNVPKNPHDLF
jgi:hypothetical protein